MLESFGPEHDAMPRLSLHSALGTALLLISPLAMALGFGPTRNQTTLGQHARLRRERAARSRREPCRATASRAEVLAGDNPVAARHVRAVLEATRDPGQRIVRVTTSIAIDEPVVTIDVSIGCGSRISRRFVAFIDPPSLRLAEAAAPVGDGAAAELAHRFAGRLARRHRPPGRRVAAPRRQRGARRRRRPAAAHGAAPRARAPAAVTVASATPAPAPKPRKQAAAARRNEPKTRTALAAAPRAGGARLQLDPPRTLAAAPRRHARRRPRCSRRRQRSRWPPRRARRRRRAPPVVPARASTDPLLAQVAAAAAAAAGASMPAASPAQERMQLLEAEVARMRGESQATQQTVAALQARVRQAEEARYRNVLVYILAATTLLGAAGRGAALVAAAAPAPPGALVRCPGQPAGPRRRPRRPVDLGRAGLAAGAAVAAGGAAAVRSSSRRRGRRRCASSPSSGWSSGSGSLMPTTQHVVDRRPRGDDRARPRALAPVGRAVRRRRREPAPRPAS